MGFIIVTDQKQKTLDAGFAGIKKLLPDGAFGGRGRVHLITAKMKMMPKMM